MTNIHRETVPKERGVKNHVDILSLTAAADAGCELCQLILEQTRTSESVSQTSLECEDQQIYACMVDYGHDNLSASMVVFHQAMVLDLVEELRLNTLVGVFLKSGGVTLMPPTNLADQSRRPTCKEQVDSRAPCLL